MSRQHTQDELFLHAELSHLRDNFVQHAFLFLKHADRILANPRMAAARVPVQNGLAYCGPLPAANLGAYLDWWQNSGLECLHHDEQGRKALLWKVAGSPLSGMNYCAYVYPDGSVDDLSISSFGKAWRALYEASKRHRPTIPVADRYTAEEVAEILETNATTEAEAAQACLTVQKRTYERLWRWMKETSDKHTEMRNKYDALYRLHYHDDIVAHRREYVRTRDRIHKELQVISEQVAASRKLLRAGQRTNEEHKALMATIGAQRKELERQLKENRNRDDIMYYDIYL